MSENNEAIVTVLGAGVLGVAVRPMDRELFVREALVLDVHVDDATNTVVWGPYVEDKARSEAHEAAMAAFDEDTRQMFKAGRLTGFASEEEAIRLYREKYLVQMGVRPPDVLVLDGAAAGRYGRRPVILCSLLEHPADLVGKCYDAYFARRSSALNHPEHAELLMAIQHTGKPPYEPPPSPLWEPAGTYGGAGLYKLTNEGYRMFVDLRRDFPEIVREHLRVAQRRVDEEIAAQRKEWESSQKRDSQSAPVSALLDEAQKLLSVIDSRGGTVHASQLAGLRAAVREAIEPKNPPRVFVYVSGGVAETAEDKGVDVVIFDQDDYDAGPDGTAKIPARFADLAELCGASAESVEEGKASLSPRM